ncbi:S-adenosyl-L-methionine-dependent methyltransferase [Irpex rosettiformis]|uniref:S-adenosyl-L-methionine-dependent methyltransferase n=1 Tax=Irpex rosettiformis TaxID=378272 RepID=A0ACB8U2J2_9APHY|nr:S-adenosyl-L-methionine-dependent methyltransferase [Irpex rosettiformis]
MHSHHQSPSDIQHGHDYVSANEAYFDSDALNNAEKPRRVELARRVCNGLRKAYPELLDEDTTELMDFACGIGLMSRELCPYVKSIVGVDVSQNAVDAYNARVNQQGLTPEDMNAVRVLLKGEEGELGGKMFDVIISVASHHHLPDIDATSRILDNFLKPGGSLLIVDILNENLGSSSQQPELLEKYKDIVVHKSGFTEAEIRGNLEQAGLETIDFQILTTVLLHDRDVKLFLARGINRRAMAPSHK